MQRGPVWSKDYKEIIDPGIWGRAAERLQDFLPEMAGELGRSDVLRGVMNLAEGAEAEVNLIKEAMRTNPALYQNLGLRIPARDFARNLNELVHALIRTPGSNAVPFG